jgi:hypothetical protein
VVAIAEKGGIHLPFVQAAKTWLNDLIARALGPVLHQIADMTVKIKEYREEPVAGFHSRHEVI